MTPVETLTAAVALYEQRREDVTAGPWRIPPPGDEYVGPYDVVGDGPPGDRYVVCEHAGCDARHIASWSPSVTDPVVQAWRALLDEIERHGEFGMMHGPSADLCRAVLASATAYLAGAA